MDINFMNVLLALLVLGILGLIFGLILAVASKIFEVKTDPRFPLIMDCLPGANCGGCGYAVLQRQTRSSKEKRRSVAAPLGVRKRRSKSPRSWVWKRLPASARLPT